MCFLCYCFFFVCVEQQCCMSMTRTGSGLPARGHVRHPRGQGGVAVRCLEAGPRSERLGRKALRLGVVRAFSKGSAKCVALGIRTLEGRATYNLGHLTLEDMVTYIILGSPASRIQESRSGWWLHPAQVAQTMLPIVMLFLFRLARTLETPTFQPARIAYLLRSLSLHLHVLSPSLSISLQTVPISTTSVSISASISSPCDPRRHFRLPEIRNNNNDILLLLLSNIYIYI